MSRVLVAMSGGVDSSVAAALLARDGHEATGVHLKLGGETSGAAAPGGRAHGCCSVADAEDARRVAQTLDIPFYVWNLTDRFRSEVVGDFLGEYAAGRTPNPCVRCNERVKFGTVLRRGIAMGFDYVATGHYAVAAHGPPRARLFRSADRGKDQSYVLSSIGPDALARALFPVGGLTKPETRATARALGLRTAGKPDSYDICFVPDGDARSFVRDALGERPGPIVEADGRVVGTHGGVHGFTVGQRRGLGLTVPQRRFVLEVDAARNTVVVGPGELLARRRILADRVRWLGDRPGAGEPVAVQIRAHGDALPARIESSDVQSVRVALDRPERGVATGQTLALYRGDEVLGGGIIAGSEPGPQGGDPSV